VGRVRHLYVLTAYRRHGIGARLVSEIVGAARGRFHTLRLTTRDPAAARLYERLGFSPVAGAADCTHARGVAARPQPRLETERLVMRMFREDDFEAYARIFGDPEVARYLGDGRPLERWEAWRSMVFHLGHWSLRGYGMWAVEEKATGALVGRVGFLYPEGWPGLELAWGLGHAWWGKGYATESARRALAWGFAELGRDDIISLVYPANAASIRVAERLGERLRGTTEIFGREALLYGIDRATWRARTA
jgi:RimJ/RimL family protein N-acetyltransferase